MLILDDSLSMASDYMPDNVNNLSGSKALCFGYSGVNRIFFDPNAAYPVPVNSSGLPLATPSWPNAKSDGYATSSSNVNLNNAPLWSNAGDSGTSSTYKTFYYVTAGTTGTSVTCPDGNSYKLTAVTTLPSALQTKYLIWYTYYRTRLLMTRGAVGLVMADIDATRFRIGLSAISDTDTADSATFLHVDRVESHRCRGVSLNQYVLVISERCRWPPVHQRRSRVGKQLAGARHELPIVTVGVQRELQHP